ncbi:MAG: helix-turn-helix transcriptional regulator [Pseudomonadota bacterium]
MRFGDYIREARRTLKWTQPEAAREIGIEQSYLSKLESGKSYPSEDVFSSLMTTYKIELSDLQDTLFAAELDRLREISAVRTSILEKEKDDQTRMRQWLAAGVAALTLGGACLGAAAIAKDTEVVKYQYRYDGVAEEGDQEKPLETVSERSADGAPEPVSMNRIKEQFASLEEYRGVVFTEASVDGTRVWRFFGDTRQTVQSPLRWFMIPGIALIMGGLGCFFASYRSR